MPETATVWDRPTREKLARAESVSPSRVPSTTASVRLPASASAKQRFRESRSIPAHTTGQNRGGVGSARSTVRLPVGVSHQEDSLGGVIRHVLALPVIRSLKAGDSRDPVSRPQAAVLRPGVQQRPDGHATVRFHLHPDSKVRLLRPPPVRWRSESPPFRPAPRRARKTAPSSPKTTAGPPPGPASAAVPGSAGPPFPAAGTARPRPRRRTTAPARAARPGNPVTGQQHRRGKGQGKPGQLTHGALPRAACVPFSCS